jgi:broad specificity phosphatase PhoE
MAINMPNVDFYFVRHAESCSNIDPYGPGQLTHPPLSYKGMQQAINLGINNDIINIDFDKYYCSPSLRTIMTACLALRSKKSEKKIILILNPYLIEHKIFTKYINQQNSIVPRKNLKNMIKYVELWFEQKYFDNYIDYEFVHLIYDLAILLYLNLTDKNEIKQRREYYDTIKKLLSPKPINRKELLLDLLDSLNKIEEKLLDVDKPINIFIKYYNIDYDKYDTNDIYNNILKFIASPYNFDLKYDLYDPKNTKLEYKKIKDRLILFTKKYNFIENITFKYNYEDEDKHTPNIEKFINNEINNEQLNKQNILCFTHGAVLRDHFKFRTNLKNTEIVHYNYIYNYNERIFNNNTVINKKLIKNTCGNILFYWNKRMFHIIDNYFNNPDYNIKTDKQIQEEFRVKDVDDELDGGKYKHKYLKYKHKYLKYKKIISI